MSLLTFLLVTAMSGLHAQATYLANEQFSASLPQGWTVQPTSTATMPTWAAVTNLQVSGNYAMHGYVPYNAGDTVEMITPFYDCSNYKYVMLKFSHICKVLGTDLCQVMYQENYLGSRWKPIPNDAYKGNNASYRVALAFDHSSYSEWKDDDTFAMANNGWWKEEVFDLSDYASYSIVRFKFVIKKGAYFGSFIADGWYIDDFQVSASNFLLNPPVVEFTKSYTDTVFTVGPYEFKAKVATRSEAPIVHPWFHYTTLYNNITTHDSIYMTDMDGGDSLWTATIPQYVYGTSFTYWINGADTVGNTARAAGSFTSKYMPGGNVTLNGDSTLFGSISTGLQNCSFPFMLAGASPSWVRMLYMAEHVRSNKSGGYIGAMAFYDASYNVVNSHNNVKIYLKATNATNLTALGTATINPIADGATLVYQGTVTAQLGWNQIKFDRGFILPAGMNLMWYVVDDDPTNQCNQSILYFTRNTGMGYNSVDHEGYFSCSSTSNGTVQDLPTTVFYFGYASNGSADSNSVAMVSIDNPTEGSVAGTQAVKVTIRNAGVANLTSAKLNWTVNGVLQPSVTYTGNLPCDFTDTVTLGYYTQRTGKYDTIVCWVNTPNGAYDSLTTDDTLEVVSYGCDSLLSGTYTVGNGNGYDFQSMEDAFFILSTCGITGDINLQLASGVYHENLDYTGFNGVGGYRLTISSMAENADSVVFRPASGTVVNLNNTSGLTFRNLTFDADSAQGYCVNIATGCSDIEFNHCRILGAQNTNSTGTNYSTIYKASGNTVSNIRFFGNEILYGSYGIYFYGGSTTMKNRNIVFDSNFIAGSYYMPAYFYYNKIRFTRNVVEEWENGNTYFYGPSFYYADSSLIDGNRIRSNNFANYHYGMRINYFDSASFVSNNEVVIYNDHTTSYGLYFYYSYGTSLVNNTVLVHGAASTHYGIYTYLYTSYKGAVKNNICVATGASTSYPLYASNITGVANFDINYNCWWGDRYIGYAGTAIGDLQSLVSAIPTAVNDINQHPVFIDSSASLELRHYTGLDCPRFGSVDHDINGKYRVPLTTRGCYANEPPAVNGILLEITNVPVNVQSGDTIYPEAVLVNGGLTTLTSASVQLEINNVKQGSPVTWTGSLLTGEQDTIALGNYVLATGDNQLTAYLVNLGTLQDSLPDDDTARCTVYACTNMISGTFTVGDTGYFESLEEAIETMDLCGMGGPVTLRMLPGTYTMNLTIGHINGLSPTNTLTITSYDEDSSTVILQRADDASGNLAPIMINGGHNIIIKHVTLLGVSPISSSYTYSHGIMITGQSHDVEVHNCYMEIPKNFAGAVTGTNQSLVYIYGGDVRDIYIHHNLMEGGATGFYVYGTNTTNRITNIRMEENEIGYIDYSAFYLYYTDSVTIKGNRVIQRVGNFSLGNMYAVYGYYTNADLIGNRFDLQQVYYGMYLYYFGDTAKNYGYIINNEMRSAFGTTTGYGIYLSSYSHPRIYHNSFYFKPTNVNHRGLYVVSSAYTTIDVQNNIFVMDGETVNSYPVYLAATTYIANGNWHVNSNAYYNTYLTSPYIGYAGGARSTLTAWQNSVACDSNSVFALPNFINVNNSLQLADSVGISCRTLPQVGYDINNAQRDSLTTTMGAWDFQPASLDMAVREILSPAESGSTAANLPLTVLLANTGKTTLTSATLRFELNGILSNPISWTGSLAVMDTTRFTLGNIRLITGVNHLKVYSYAPNGGTDGFVPNDTLTMDIYGCDGAISGSFTVGDTSSDFKTMEDAVNTVRFCGISGPVTLNVKNGTYDGLRLEYLEYDSLITICSQSGNSGDVVFYDQSGAYLKEVSNITLKNVTFAGTVIGAELVGDLTNVEFSHCNILAPANVTNAAYRGVSYANTSGSGQMLKDVRFIGNYISGGYYNFYLYYTASGTNYLTSASVTIDSNVLAGAYYYGIYSYYYNHFKSISHNTITNGSHASIFYGLYQYYYHNTDQIVGNRIHLNNSSTSYGMYLYYYQNYPSYGGTPSPIANNEIILTGNGVKYGIYQYYYAQYNLVNNSIYVKGSSTSYGMYLYNNSTSYKVNVVNNNLVNDYTTGYALYNAYANSYAPTYGERDYNNYFSRSGNLAYLNGATKTTLAAIQAVDANQDQHSVNVTPVWSDTLTPLTHLQLTNSSSLRCPVAYNIHEDMLAVPRKGNTAMGCYGLEPDSVDAALLAFEGIETATSVGTHPISVIVSNMGTSPLDTAVIYLTINGTAATPVVYAPVTPLAYLQQDTVLLGNFAFQNGNCTFEAYIVAPTDAIHSNDTIVYKKNICSGLVSGTYIVGNSSNADYTLAKIGDLMNDMILCGVAGDLTVLFETGSYSTSTIMDLSAIAAAMGNHHLTISSMAEDKDSVTITSTTTKLVNLSGNNNVTIRNLTLASTTGNIIYIAGECNNIEISHNYLKSVATGSSTAYNPIYKPSGTGVVKDFRIIGNRIEGGYYGIYLYGVSTGEYNTDVMVDSNEIYDQYYYATYFYYTGFRHVFNNTLYPRTSGGSTYWYGLRFYYCNFKDGVCYNSIDATKGSNIVYPYGIYAYYTNYNLTTDQTLFANNAIKVSTSSSYYGAYIYYGRINFYHNTILMSGTGASRALYYSSSTAYPMNIKGNIFVTPAGGHPIYAGVTTAGVATIDYNNYYGGGNYVAYFGGNQTSIASLQAANGMDAHSVSKPAQFTNSAVDLRISNSSDFLIPRLSGVTSDFEGVSRGSLTAMGAYEAEFAKVDAALVDFAGTSLDSTVNPVYVTLTNFGKDTLKSATIHWSVNGVQQTAVNWTGALPLFSSASVQLGNCTSIPTKMNEIKAWVSNPNNSTDGNHSNDTVEYNEYLCSGALSGTYTMGGSNADFNNGEEMLMALYTCGVNAPVVIKVRSGNYGTLSFDGKISGSSKTNTITILPDSAATVVFDGGSSDAGLVLHNVSNMLFKGLTFGNTANGLEGVRMEGACSNVTIRECNIYACTTANGATYRAFSYPNTSGSTNFPVDVNVIANNIAGGYYNMYLYYIAGSTDNMGASSMTIDSNVMTDAYYYGIYAYYYGAFNSISYNRISSRYAASSNNSGIYYGLYSYYYKNFGRVEGNRIYVNNTSTGYGMYLYYYQNSSNYTSHRGLVINNEIRMSGNNVKYGMYVYGYYSGLDIHHNSVYALSETSTAYGMYLAVGTTTTQGFPHITRNLFVADGLSNSYPLYISNTYFQSTYSLREWNNLYSATNVGYASGAKTTIADFQQTTGQDSHSVSISPSFVRLRDGLELNNYDPFTCPSISTVTSDINGNMRAASTAMGCYGAKMWDGVNLLVDEFLSPVAIADVVCYEDSTPVEIVIKNMGRDIAYFDSSSLKVDLDVTGPINFHFDTLFTSGDLRPTQSMNIRFPMVPTMASGVYTLKVKLTNNEDVLLDDDTMSLIYNATRVELPYDADFTATPDGFVTTALSGNTTWNIASGSGTTPAVSPVYGNNRLEFAGAGNPGAFANAIFNAVNISGCLNPKLSFWFAHSADNTRRDLTVVLITTDGGQTYTEVGRIMVTDTFTGWRQYDVDLNRFANSNCLSILFQGISYGGANQSLDRVRITADQDAAIELLPIDYSALSACENDAVPLRAVIVNQTALNMEITDDTLHAEVTGAATQSFRYVYSNQLGGYERDTITMGTLNLNANGNYYISMFMQSQDDNTLNDSLTDSTLYVFQDLALDSIIGIDNQMAKVAGDSVWVSALVRNNSNLPVDRFLVRMELDGEEVVTDTVSRHLEAGDTLTHDLSLPYVVPFGSKEQPFYFLEVSAILSCDADNGNGLLNVVGNIHVPDTIDLQVLNIARPASDSGRVRVNPTVTVANIANTEVYTVMMRVDVLDSAMTLLETVSEYISFININDTVDYDFSLSYTVPNYNGKYFLRAYVDTYTDEVNTANDTLTAQFNCLRNEVAVPDFDDAGWNLGQNRPNPARNATVIPFSLPEDATVTLTVMSASGQLLRSEVIEATAGENSFSLNVENLAAGIYYYTMEFKGQRLVRKMNVVK